MDEDRKHPAPTRVTDDWLTVKQAAVEQGVSEATIRRMVRAGELEAEVLPRRGGQTTFRVRQRQAESEPRQPASAPNQAALDLAAALTASLSSVAEHNHQRALEIIKQAERIAALERENGRLEAQCEQQAAELQWGAQTAMMDQARLKQVEADLAAARAELARLEARRPWYRRIWR